MFVFLKKESFFKELIWPFLVGIYILYNFFSILTLHMSKFLEKLLGKLSLIILYSMFPTEYCCLINID